MACAGKETICSSSHPVDICDRPGLSTGGDVYDSFMGSCSAKTMGVPSQTPTRDGADARGTVPGLRTTGHRRSATTGVSARPWCAHAGLSRSEGTREPPACRRARCFQCATPSGRPATPRGSSVSSPSLGPVLRDTPGTKPAWLCHTVLPNGVPPRTPQTYSPVSWVLAVVLSPCRTPFDCGKLSQGDAQDHDGRSPSLPGGPQGPSPGDGWALCPGRPELLTVHRDRLWTDIAHRHRFLVLQKNGTRGDNRIALLFVHYCCLSAGQHGLE